MTTLDLYSSMVVDERKWDGNELRNSLILLFTVKKTPRGQMIYGILTGMAWDKILTC